MDSLKTYSVGVYESPRKRTCVVCRNKIPANQYHVVIHGKYRFSLKFCKHCLRQLSYELFIAEGDRHER